MHKNLNILFRREKKNRENENKIESEKCLLEEKKKDEKEYREINEKYNRKIYACETHSFFNSLLPNFVH